LKNLATVSLSVMEGNSYNPKDDLESLAYTYMYLVKQSEVTWARDSDAEIIIKKKRIFITDNITEK
jgi:hypothetical protein